MRTGAEKKSGILWHWRSQIQRQHFSRFSLFRVPFDYPVHSLQEILLPQPMVTNGKPRLKVCLLLVWRVGDQAFGKYRPLKGAEKWSRDHENWKFAYRHVEKFHRFQKCYSFQSTTKDNEVIKRKNRFSTVASPGSCERFAVLNWRSSSVHTSSYSYSFDDLNKVIWANEQFFYLIFFRTLNVWSYHLT